MPLPPLYVLSEVEKNELLLAQHDMIELMAARISELEELVGKPRKTSKNSHVSPSTDNYGKGGGKGRKAKPGKRPSCEGKHRPLAETPDKTERVIAAACGHCGGDVRSDPAMPASLRLYRPAADPSGRDPRGTAGRTLRGCGHRYRAQAPAGMEPGTSFGPGIRALLAYLHHSHHVSFERLSRIASELFGLSIYQGAISNAFWRMEASMAMATGAITDKLLTARVIASDETSTRTNSIIHWHWVFLLKETVLHRVAGRRARSVVQEVLGGHQPDVWTSDRYAGQQELGKEHQVCLARVLRDVQCAIDCGDRAFAPKVRDHLRRAIRIGKRPSSLKDTTLAAYCAKADTVLTHLMRTPIAHRAGKILLRQIKAWRGKFFVFLTNRDIPATNNISECEIRPSVVFRKVTNGFRSDWRAQIHAGYRSVTGTARLQGKSAFQSARELIKGRFAIA